MSYDDEKGRNDVKIFSKDDYDYQKHEVVVGSVLEKFLAEYDTEDIDVEIQDEAGSSKTVTKKGVVNAAGNKITNEPYIMIHVFPVFMIAYGKLIAKEQQPEKKTPLAATTPKIPIVAEAVAPETEVALPTLQEATTPQESTTPTTQESTTPQANMVLVLKTLAAIDELRAPGWLEEIRMSIGSVVGMFDEGSSMYYFINAISNYEENKKTTSMYAEVNLLRNDDRLNGQPPCINAPVDVDIMMNTTGGPGAITKVDSALNSILNNLEKSPEITTNPVGLEVGSNPKEKLGKHLVVSTPGLNRKNKGRIPKNAGEADGMVDDNDYEMLGGRKRSLSKHKKRKNKTRRIGLRAQFSR
jgi:hypothetical protein